jgi:hypothetical protein
MNEILLAVTGVSLLLAGFTSAIAWRMTREERRRSDARVAALSSAIYEEAGEPSGALRLFDHDSAPSGARYGLVVAAGACVVCAIVGFAVIAARTSNRPAMRAEAAHPASDVPLELLALENERDGEQLTVRGIVAESLRRRGA